MKTMLKLFIAVLMSGICSLGYGQADQPYRQAPKANEKVIVSMTKEITCRGGWYTDEPVNGIYQQLLEIAISEYPNVKNIDIRNLKGRDVRKISDGVYLTACTFTIVGEDSEASAYKNLSTAINKALRNVREGSRVAIDQVVVINNMGREEFKDQLIDVLLDKGYKVVAKDYLEKLYEEQQNQQSGIYNDKTTVQENNFSAVGYYINVKVSETSLRVQVVNVSTGEYEGNATVTF